MATDLVREAGERFGLTGALIGVADGDSEEVLGLGVTSADDALAVDGDTLFQMGSITKTPGSSFGPAIPDL